MGYDPLKNRCLLSSLWKKQTSTSTDTNTNEHSHTFSLAKIVLLKTNHRTTNQLFVSTNNMATASNDLFTTPGSSDDEDDDDSAAGQLQKFFENDKNVKPADKIPYIINLCFAYLDDFSTQAAPYNHQLFKNSKKNHKISNPLLKVEIKRRDSSAKLSNKKQNDLLELLKSNPLPAKDIEYLKRQESSYKAKCQQAIDEHAQSSTAAAAPAPSDRGPNITLDDKFRLIEAFFSDKAKERKGLLPPSFVSHGKR